MVTPSPPSAAATNPPVEERITARSGIAVGHAIGGDDGTDLAGGPCMAALYIYDTKLTPFDDWINGIYLIEYM